MKKILSTITLLTIAQFAMAESVDCRSHFGNIARLFRKIGGGINYAGRSLIDSRGLSLIGHRTQNSPHSVVHSSPVAHGHSAHETDLYWGILKARHDHDAIGFLHTLDKWTTNMTQFVPRKIINPMFLNLMHDRASVNNQEYDLALIYGLFKHFSAKLTSLPAFKNSPYYKQKLEVHLLWKTMVKLSLMGTSGLGIYLTVTDPLSLITFVGEHINEVTEDEKYDAIIENDWRFEDLKQIENKKYRNELVNKRISEMKYFEAKLLEMLNEEKANFFEEMTDGEYGKLYDYLSIDDENMKNEAKEKLSPKFHQAIARFEGAGTDEFKWMRQLSEAETIASMEGQAEEYLGKDLSLVIRTRDARPMCDMKCPDLEALAHTDRLIKGQIKGYLRAKAVDLILFEKEKDSKKFLETVKEYPVLENFIKEIEGSDYFKRIKKTFDSAKTDIFVRRGLLMKIMEFKTRSELLKSMGQAYVLKKSEDISPKAAVRSIRKDSDFEKMVINRLIDIEERNRLKNN